VRGILKNGVERALSSAPVGRIARDRIRGKRMILAYHGIVPRGAASAGERSLFVAQQDFSDQLDAIASIADVVSLDSIDAPGTGRARVAITFDDAYRGAVKEGVRELVRRGFPATIFVAPGRLNDHVFWWDALSHSSPQLDEAVRHHALHRLAGADERVRTWAARIRLPTCDALPAYAQTATREELLDAVAFPGITLGCHTWSHANLAALDEATIASEIERSRDWLRANFGDKAIPWIAYPYGLDSVQAHKAARIAGYCGGLRIGGGWHNLLDVSPLARPRLNVPASLSIAGFRARMLGVIPS
jgi:peptidoglycan/xylan/chitin deacetylase (PgdA/CDA1 family)